MPHRLEMPHLQTTGSKSLDAGALQENLPAPPLKKLLPHDRKKRRDQPCTRSYLYSNRSRFFRVNVSRACFSAINGRRQPLPTPELAPPGRSDLRASLLPSIPPSYQRSRRSQAAACAPVVR